MLKQHVEPAVLQLGSSGTNLQDAAFLPLAQPCHEWMTLKRLSTNSAEGWPMEAVVYLAKKNTDR